MKNINCKILKLVFIFTLAAAVAVPSLASNLSQSIDISFRDIKLVINGVSVTPKDAAGNEVEPFIYNGTTYLPVRAVGEALGQQVGWDGDTNTVYIGEVPGETKYLLDVCPPYQTAGNVQVFLPNDGDSFSMSGVNYANGLKMASDMYGNDSYAVFNLNGEYSSLSFDFGHFDEARHDMNAEYKIYLDGELVDTLCASPDTLAQNYTINLSGALQLKIETSYTHCVYCFGNMIVE